jgi:hypothetical protein
MHASEQVALALRPFFSRAPSFSRAMLAVSVGRVVSAGRCSCCICIISVRICSPCWPPSAIIISLPVGIWLLLPPVIVSMPGGLLPVPPPPGPGVVSGGLVGRWPVVMNVFGLLK